MFRLLFYKLDAGNKIHVPIYCHVSVMTALRKDVSEYLFPCTFLLEGEPVVREITRFICSGLFYPQRIEREYNLEVLKYESEEESRKVDVVWY